jgi:hypothetical protein
VTLVDKLELPQHGWTSVVNSWCPHYNMGTWCTIDIHATFIPPEDHRDTENVILDSQAAVLKWTMDFPRDETDREDGSGLEFECQLNAPSLARLHQLKKLGCTNTMAVRRTLFDKQDLLRTDAGGFVDEGYHTTRGEWWVGARAEECSRAWSARQVDPEGWCASCKKDKSESEKESIRPSRNPQMETSYEKS